MSKLVQESITNMRKIMPPNIKFIYTDKPESTERLKLVYDRVFMMARQNIIERQKVDKRSLAITLDLHRPSG